MSVSLLKTIDGARLEQLLADDAWCLQQKFDGVRCVVKCRAGELTATGRTGRPVNLGFCGTLFPTDEDYELDGELAWGCFYAFDSVFPHHCRLPYVERLQIVADLVDRWNVERIRRPVTYATTEGKREALRRAIEQRVEGVVLKRLDAAWWSGVDESRGVRFKFVRRAEVVVSTVGREGRRSCVVGAYDPADGATICVGRVPLTTDAAWREVQEAVANLAHEPVIEVQYLYATPDHQLYQPKFIRVRYDKAPTPADCSLAQLAYTHKGELDGGPCETTYPEPAPAAPRAAGGGSAGRVGGGSRSGWSGGGRPRSRKGDLEGGLAILVAIATCLLCAVGLFLRITRGLPVTTSPSRSRASFGLGRSGGSVTRSDDGE